MFRAASFGKREDFDGKEVFDGVVSEDVGLRRADWRVGTGRVLDFSVSSTRLELLLAWVLEVSLARQFWRFKFRRLELDLWTTSSLQLT